MDNKKIALFSGRFDCFHIGHAISIKKLTQGYDVVKVVILDYPERLYPSTYISQVIKELFEGTPVIVYINSTHFAKITSEELLRFQPFTHYYAGNMSVLNHVSKLGIKCYWIDRSYHYNASTYRIGEGVKSLIEKV